jgi:hypothetical protein
MRNSSPHRTWISVVALTIFILTGSASLSAQGVQNTGSDIQFHKFVPIIPPENSAFAAKSSDPAQVNAAVGQQVQLLMQEKFARTPAQQKIDSNVLYTIRMMRGQQAAPGITSMYTGVDLDQKNRIAVDIVANVTDALLQQMATDGAIILSSNKDYRAIRALIPPDQIEALAASPDISFIGPKVGSITSGLKFTPPAHAATKGGLAPGFDMRAARVRKQIAAYLQQHPVTNVAGTPGVPNTGQGSVTTEGDATHQAAAARGVYGVSGVGLKIGVLSDSANNKGAVTSAQATGDLPPTCPGPGGPCLTVVQDDPSGGTDEGAAMLEIVYDMVPGANLYFATADISEAQFAANIVALQAAGCNIIVDDVFYFDEPVFQDGIVAQAVTTVTTSGAMYFSSAGNEGNLSVNTSGVFEGDFNDAGSVAFTFPGGTKTGTIHNFGSIATPVNGDIITSSGEEYTLNWADPSGASGNDYDLFLVNSVGTIKAQSTNIQSGTQNPFEAITPPALAAGDRLVVFKVTGAASLAFSINTLRGTLTNATTGQTHGHSAAAAAFSVGAAPAAAAFNGVAPAGPFPNPFTTANQTELFSSDGPRRIFFNANGTPVTAGNFLFATNGGVVRPKPDVTAADGVHTTLPANSGLNPFYGTSAAAPAAASVAALIMSAKPTLTPAQVGTTLTSTALDIGAAGRDSVSGNGIVMALAALNSLGITGFADVELGTITATENPGNGNGVIEAGEGGLITIQLKNTNGVQDAKNITAVLSTTTPGVTISQPGSSAYPNLPLGTGTGNNVTPFTFTLASNFPCGSTLSFTLTLTYTNGPAATKALNFSVPLGITVTISNTLGGATPSISPSAGITFATGTQTDRINRVGGVSVCGTQKLNPGLVGAGGTRVFDSYTFTNATTAAVCLNPVMNSANGVGLETDAYNAAGFVPTDPSINYAADQGSSSATETFGYSVPAGAATTIVVNDVNVISGGVGSGSAYSIQFPACILFNNAAVNHPPTAVAQNVTVTAATIGGTAAANINNGSSDPDAGDTITLSQNPPGPYPVGVTSVFLTVTDSKGAMAQATANVTVLNPPTITTLSPSTVVAGSGAFTLTVTGTNFVNGSVVNFNGAAKATSFQNSTSLTASILSTDVTTAGTPSVTVTNPGAVTSAGTTFTISGAATPDLTITKTHTGNFTQGQVGATYAITVTNSGSASTTGTVTVADTLPVGLTATAMSGTGWICTFATGICTRADVLAAAGVYPVITLTVNVAANAPATVVNSVAVSGGGETNTANDIATNSTTVTSTSNPVPAITSITPNPVSAGSPTFTLTVNGSNFVSTSVVDFNGAAQPTTFVSSTQLTTTITAAQVQFASLANIFVVNPAPGGGNSNTIVLAINTPVPTLTTLAPSSAVAGGPAFTLTVNGTNFENTAVVQWNGSNRTTSFVSATQLTAAITAADIVSVGTASVVVFNPLITTGGIGGGHTQGGPGGAFSNTLTFAITATGNPVATITTLAPSSALVGSGAFTLTVNGTNFISTSAVKFNGVARVTTFVSATQVTAAILATDIATIGVDPVTVTNPTPGGGTSNAVNFTVNNPIPVLTSLSPNSVSAGSGAFTLTVNGTGFVSGASLTFNGSARVTTFVSATQVTAAILATDVSTLSFVNVNVTNPAPGGGTSNSLIFGVTTPVPAITSLVPNTAVAGGAGFNMIVNGSNFLNTSVVLWNGGNRVTTFVSATQLSAAVTAADIAAVGTASVRVFTPNVALPGSTSGAPVGTTSNALTFTITAANPLPTLTSISPSTIGAGGAAFTMTLTGTNFISSSVANFKGSPRVTTFVSATQLTAAITAADIAASGTAAITVVTPTPGGGTTGAVNLTITDFSVTSPNPTQTVTAGQTASFTIATAPVGGAFTGNVTFTTSALPQGAAASFNPSSVASGSSTTMSITTTARGTAFVTRPPFNQPSNPSSPIRPLWLITLVLALTSLTIAKFGRRNVKRLIPIGAFALLLISAGYLSGCAGSGFPKVGSNTGTPAGTYPITVTGTSGTVQHSTIVTLIVQ